MQVQAAQLHQAEAECKLHHSQKGALSISLTGAEFAITFAKVLTLDSSYQESPGCALFAAPSHALDAP